MLDLKIDRLQLNIENGTGHEHRLRPIALRAVALLADRLDARRAEAGQAPDRQETRNLRVPPVSLNLNGMSDEQAAAQIADALLETLAIKIGV
jgi:hypothetical protein